MGETVLLVGGGGREHAIARALDVETVDLYACAGNRNPGIDSIAAGYRQLDPTDTEAVVSYATEVSATLAVVGPEAPLAAGVVDELDDAGVFAFGPTAANARIETDKAFQRRFMSDHGIPGCPEYETFSDPDKACAFIDEYDGDLAIKPVGLTGGKGVKVIGDQVSAEEGKEYIRGSDHDAFVLEERLIGEEFTLQAIVANGHVETSPAIQDHKRAYEGDEGPNTGGMGSYSDTARTLPFMTEADYEAATKIIDRTVSALEDYTGVLYGQFMLTADGPKVVEFNARFGDPEAMNTLPILETSFLDVLIAARDSDGLPELRFSSKATVCKYAVPAGYPTDPRSGTRLPIDDASLDNAQLFYASVDAREDGIYTTTSRSFAVVGIGDSIAEAESIAQRSLDAIGDDGLHMRRDIGTESLVRRRIDHMAEIRGG